MTTARPLRGRSAALARALSVLQRARRDESGGLVLITGPAGIGKTALLAEILRQARGMDFRVAAAACEEIGQMWPAAAVLSALRNGRRPMLTPSGYAEIRALADQPLRLAERITAYLEDAAREQPVLLAVDDMQWADRVGRFVLRTLSAQTVGLPIVVVLASRDPAGDPQLSDVDVVQHLALDPLSMPDVLAVARDRLGTMPDTATSRMLETADGNPFLVADMLDNLRTGCPPAKAGKPPGGFTLAVHSRLSGLDSEVADVTRLVAGQPLPIAIALPLLSDLHPGADVAAAATRAAPCRRARPSRRQTR
jgi:predicted ATPase